MLRTVRADRRRGPPAPGAHRSQRGARLHRSGRRELPEDVHRARRHGRTRGAADGEGRRGRDLGLGRGLSRGGGSFASTELEPLRSRARPSPCRPSCSAISWRKPRGRARDVARTAVLRSRARARGPRRLRRAGPHGFGTLVELVGEPGIGKSRLAQELRENCADMRQIYAALRAVRVVDPLLPVSPVPPLAPRRRAQRRRGAQPHRARERLALDRRGARPVGSAPRRAARRRRRVDARGARPRPFLLAGAPARRRWDRCSGTCSTRPPCSSSTTSTGWTTRRPSSCATSEPSFRREPWLACTTRRPGEDGFAAAERHAAASGADASSRAAPEDDAKTLALAAAGDRRLSDDELAALMERGAGNPLFLQELAVAGTDEAEELPETVEALVATRIDRLAPGDRLSSAGHPCSGVRSPAPHRRGPRGRPDSGGRLRGVGPTWRVRRARSRRPGAFRFRHALIRDAAYEGLAFRTPPRAPCSRRRGARGAHTRTAVELLSLHYHRAEAAGDVALLAGGGAERPGRVGEPRGRRPRARARGREGGAGDRSGPEIAQVWEALGDCRQLAGRFEAQRQTPSRGAPAIGRASSPRSSSSSYKEATLQRNGPLRGGHPLVRPRPRQVRTPPAAPRTTRVWLELNFGMAAVASPRGRR